MWNPKSSMVKKAGNGLTAVAIDKDKGSQNALKWALENLLFKGQTVVLLHVLHKSSSFAASNGLTFDGSSTAKEQYQKLSRELFLSFRCFCTRKDIAVPVLLSILTRRFLYQVNCIDVVVTGSDIAKAITEYVSNSAIENLVLSSSRHGFIRRFKADVPSSVSKLAPDFCNVYIISKGKISTMRKAIRQAPFTSPLLEQIENQNNDDAQSTVSKCRSNLSLRSGPQAETPRVSVDGSFRGSPVVGGAGIRSPFGRDGREYNVKSFADLMESQSDISFVSSDRPSTDRMSFAYDYIDMGRNLQFSTCSDTSYSSSMRSGQRLVAPSFMHELSPTAPDSGRTSSFSATSQSIDDMESEMRRLKLELKQTMDLYNAACREALTANQKASEMNKRKVEEEKRLEEARFAEDATLAVLEEEKARCRQAIESAEAAKRAAEEEAQRRLNIELKAVKEVEEMKKLMDSLAQRDIRYRRYKIEDIEEATQNFSESRKIGEGGYGPVYRCYLDHTPVAVKVLRPDAAQGRTQFRREIEVLSSIRHPNMVLLLGACPEYGILVYEYMAKGSLEDCLFHRGNKPALPWQIRFRIAAEIATGLLFLHQNKPEPLVHRDLKPGNILLDSNYTSKISDVGLARLVPAVADNITQYHMTSAAGTFCYIDPEYQQTGILGVKSDIYSLGIMLLQLLTTRPPMGLTHQVEQAIEDGTFPQILDPAVTDWPLEETLTLAKLSLKCAELRRKDRPDLDTELLPELNKLREFAEEKLGFPFFAASVAPSPNHSQVSMDMVSDPLMRQHSVASSKSQLSSASLPPEPTENSDEN
ncbi:hypothetical protein Tsubulata_006354 [Turnera subulata]|uniref:RING-type E3 ubiquitin transferase n=1 Tax=Turnera subulata TaxID=218843 RepID=A0A9Q0G7A1_9ROSI|nr:hypothetical protein Tsubulata_006354 [Turnera subulata]